MGEEIAASAAGRETAQCGATQVTPHRTAEEESTVT